MRRGAVVWLVLAAGLACTEDLTVTGVCPEYCPPGELIAIDTVIRDLVHGDSAFRGYVQAHEAAVMLAADLPGVIDARAIFTTTLLASRVRLGTDTTTGPVVGVDSMRLTLGIVRRDTAARGLSLAFHRVPRTLDSTTTFADLAGDFAAPPIRVVHLDSLIALPGQKDSVTGDSVVVDSAGAVTLLVSFDSVEVPYTAADSGRLGIGIRVGSDSLSGSGRASVAIGAGSTGPVLTWFAKVDSLGLAVVQRGLGGGAAFDSYVVDPPPAPLDSTLAVGGAPSARSLLRFGRPTVLFDSTQIVRATLILVPQVAATGAPTDSLRVIAQRIVADLGSKSPLAGAAFAGDVAFFGDTYVRAGSLDTVRIDVTGLVRRWQADTAAPAALMLRVDPEGGTLGEIRFAPSVAAAVRPALQVTYVPSFPFGER
jgi:hypothetical protein